MAVTIRRRAAWAALFRALRSSGGPGMGVGQRVRALPRMLSMGLNGRYPHLDRGRLLGAGLALLYLVSPIDLMPEAFLWIFGLGDDALVAAWLAGVVLSETETFLAWERATSGPGAEPGVRVVVGEVLDQR
ncbi:MAG: YkvA family protein [Kineosporiaceae bacterium]